MATTPVSPRSLPQNPSAEYLRKQAKRLGRNEAMQLAAAQRQLAHDYGYRNWAELMTAVEAMASPPAPPSGADDSSAPGSPPAREGARSAVPLLPLRELVAFPHVSYPVYVGRAKSITALTRATEHNTSILLVAQRDARVAEPAPTDADMYEVGTIGALRETQSLADGTMRCVTDGKRRVRISRFLFDGEFYQAEAEELDELAISDPGLAGLMSSLLATLRQGLKPVDDQLIDELEAIAPTADGASILADRVASGLGMKLEFKQALLEVLDPRVRLEIIAAYLDEMAETEEKWQTLLRRAANTPR